MINATLRGAFATAALLLQLPLAAHAGDSGDPKADARDVRRFDWAGSFVGVHGGFARGRSEATEARVMGDDPALCSPASTPGNYICNINGPTHHTPTPTPSYNLIGDRWGMDMNGSVAGIHAGFNRQVGNFVWGGVVSWSALKLKGVSGFSPASVDDTRLTTTATDVATARFRLGYAFDRIHVFGAIGAAMARFNSYVSDPDIAIGIFTEKTDTQFGLVLGGGVEYALSENIIISVDYQNMMFASSQVAGPINLTCLNGGAVCDPNFWKTYRASMPDGGTAAWDVRQTLNVIQAGVAYKF